MKVLKTTDFISERIKVQPITNAELDATEKEMNAFKKIDNPSFADIRKGNAVYVDSAGERTVYIVFDVKTLPSFLKSYLSKHAFDNNPETIMIRYGDSNKKCYYRNVKTFKNEFPYREGFEDVKIIGIYSTNINVDDMQSFEDLNKEYAVLYEKIKIYDK